MSLTSLFNQAISIYNSSSVDRYGKEVLGSASTCRARVQVVSKPRLHFASEGSDAIQYVIAAIIYVKPDTTVEEGDKIAYNGTNYRVHGKSVATDGQGQTNHIRLECTKWNI